jgi:hypothetical protein
MTLGLSLTFFTAANPTKIAPFASKAVFYYLLIDLNAAL